MFTDFTDEFAPILKVLSDKKLSDVRNIIKEQNLRIARLERQITQMRQRREWGDTSSIDESKSKSSTTTTTSSTESASTSSESSSESASHHHSPTSDYSKTVTR